MPFSHEHWITTLEEIEQVLSYNKNDVYATNEFLNVTLGNTDNPLYKEKNKIATHTINSLTKRYNKISTMYIK